MGPEHLDTLLLEAKAARLQHAAAPSDGSGVTRLREVVGRLEVKMGAEHPQTRKYRAALNEIETVAGVEAVSIG